MRNTIEILSQSDKFDKIDIDSLFPEDYPDIRVKGGVIKAGDTLVLKDSKNGSNCPVRVTSVDSVGDSYLLTNDDGGSIDIPGEIVREMYKKM